MQFNSRFGKKINHNNGNIIYFMSFFSSNVISAFPQVASGPRAPSCSPLATPLRSA